MFLLLLFFGGYSTFMIAMLVVALHRRFCSVQKIHSDKTMRGAWEEDKKNRLSGIKHSSGQESYSVGDISYF